jgi:MFS family permease
MATTSSATTSSPEIRSLIPARIDRLPWSRFHMRLVTALGVAWILDGLEITIAANVGPDLTLKNTLNMSAGAVSDIAWWYLIGEVIGALFFGRLSDKLGRRNLFMITLGVYLIGSGLTAVTPDGGHWFIFLYATRVVAGMGIGGEYAAINSAIDEMIPARYRGRIDLAVNGTYWAGAILGTIITLAVLNHITAFWGWRIAYIVGPVLALCIIYVRRNLPESPRWQIMHGRQEAAEASMREIEEHVVATTGPLPPVDESKELEIRPSTRIGYAHLLRALFRQYPKRSVLVAALMITQSFLYNAIFFTYGLVLEFFFHVKATDTAYYFFAFAAGNLAGPLTLGRLFDTIGRKKMISGTYITAGVLLAISAELFRVGDLNATTQTLCWAVVFFFASAGASAGYLTASEVFPLEVRAQSIAVFFAIAQCFGAFGSHWYGHLIGDGTDRNSLFAGYLVGAGAMILGGIVAIFFGVAAEGKALEDVARPLSVIGKPSEAIFRTGADEHVVDPTVPRMRRRGTDAIVTGTPDGGIAPDSVPDPRSVPDPQSLAKHDDSASALPDDES